MKLYKIYQAVNNSYDTYDSAIVCASNEEDAKTIHPGGGETGINERPHFETWCGLKDVNVDYIGEADSTIERGVIVSSFNAG